MALTRHRGRLRQVSSTSYRFTWFRCCWEVIGTVRYDNEGRLAEEWVETDYRSFLTKLGLTTTETAPPAARS